MTNFELIRFWIDIIFAIIIAVLSIVFIHRQSKVSIVFFNASSFMFVLYLLTEAADIIRFPIFLIDIYTELIPIFYISALLFICLYMTVYVRDEIDNKNYTESLIDSSKINVSLKLTDYVFNISLYVMTLPIFCIVGLNLVIRNFLIPTSAFSIIASVMMIIILLTLCVNMQHKSNCLLLILLAVLFIIYYSVSILVDDLSTWLFIANSNLSLFVEHLLKTLYVTMKIICLLLLVFVYVKRWVKKDV